MNTAIYEKKPASNAATNTDAIYYKDATELTALIRTKQLSSREVVRAHLDRIAAVNPKINAIVTLLANDALKGADSADKAVKDGAELGPLHGVPFTIKNTIDTAGVLTQRGSRIPGAVYLQFGATADQRPDYRSEVRQTLKARHAEILSWNGARDAHHACVFEVTANWDALKQPIHK
jgi:Asp-tRNA(Asn)/Glu-tRNA(Gln) amidotransferase A subunit family amidase